MKNKVIEYLQEKNIRVEDMGNYELDPLDDNPDYAHKVAQAVLQNPDEFLGIVICGSGVGVSITANRHKGVRCALAFNTDEVHHAKENDHINVIALPSDFIDFEKAKEMIDVFIKAQPKQAEKYYRRLDKMDAG